MNSTLCTWNETYVLITKKQQKWKCFNFGIIFYDCLLSKWLWLTFHYVVDEELAGWESLPVDVRTTKKCNSS